MHHCLEIPEILCNILRTLHEDSKPSLVATATTCRYFLEPALDILWESKETLVPLIKCMPEDLWSDSEEARFYKLLSFTRKIVPEDWVRFNYYAPRIKRLSFPGRQISQIHTRLDIAPNVFQRLRATAKKHPLLPNLCHLQCEVFHDFDSLIHIHLFLGPKLSTLSSTLPRDSKMGLVFDSVKKFSPNLEVLHLTEDEFSDPFEEPNEALTIALSAAICEMQHLRSLSCGGGILTPEAVHHLVALPLLCSLNISNLPSNILKDIAEYQPGTCLLALQHLTLLGESLIHTAALLNHLRPQKLKSLVIRCHNIPSSHDLHKVLEAVKSNCSHDNFDSFTIELESWYSSSSYVDEGYSAGITGPLMAFRNMNTLKLDLPFPFEIDNVALEKMSPTWRHLRCLCLGNQLRGTPCLTLDGLALLVAHCPDLEDIRIVINAVCVAPYSSTRPGNGFSNGKVKRLALGHSTLEDPMVVASFLSDLFPNLRRIDAWSYGGYYITDEDEEGWRQKWHLVEAALLMFAKTREQERNWSKKSMQQSE